ncbi:phosphatase PAP2 family protein [Ruminococcus sp. OA3]|uniref:phosphatase PAP2 family protein n=1 Tax=Oscillospiraceae TaxID=216572 RepID=UPI0021F06DAA|nr:phosphatase PAP2 family protein [Ruminococcus sp. OA3]
MRLIRKYKHGFTILIFGIVYMFCFAQLEKRSVEDLHIICAPLNDVIPFCEYFVVPYIFWFVYMFVAILFFIFVNPDKREYYQMFFSLASGMTLFLIVSYVYPNGLNIRPAEFANDNIFTDIVQLLYRHDTPTNVLPSIHVFNSLCIHLALANSKMLRQDRWLKWASLILTLAIIASTLFLKQHSLIDVITGIILCMITYFIFYKSSLVSRLPS